MTAPYATLTTRPDGNVLFVTFHAPPINLIGPEVVRDLVGLLEELSAPSSARVVVFESADPDFCPGPARSRHRHHTRRGSDPAPHPSTGPEPSTRSSPDALIAAKAAINAISLPPLADVRADAALFQQLVRGEEAQHRTAELFKRGLQTRGRTELDLGDALGDVARRAARGSEPRSRPHPVVCPVVCPVARP
ncbi:hypothetical protein [Streptomyces platensis]|uniref:hypothetical protein n=1 Tax=Streptomyces platensis TaxID=58346 RepID=UPI001F1D0DFF|nr:hypothetical protein [Streptomyces platensis]MCF3141703.1 hypothetical protein [Streptomyces platensis]